MIPFKQKITDHYDQLFSFCLSRTHNLADAEDLAHDTIIKALKYQDTYEEKGKFWSWLRLIATRLHVNQWQRETKYQEKITETEKMTRWTHSDRPASPDHTITERQECEKILELVREHVPEPYRTPLLAYASGQKYEEIADDLGVPLGTVMSRIYRARKRIPDCIR